MSPNLVSDLLLNRRSALLGGAGLMVGSAVAASGGGKGRGLDFNDPADNLYAFGKIWAGYDTPVVGAFHGLMYLRIPGKRMIPVFGYTGTGALLARIDENKDLWIKSRETGYFTDLRTGDILETWENPLTGKTVPVYHFYNDILVGKVGKEIPKFFFGAVGDSPTLMNEGTVFPNAEGRYPFLLPFQQYGDDLMLSWDYTHDYTNPVTPDGWPRSSTGPRTTPSEHFTFSCSRQALEDRDLPTVRMQAGFTRISECWPFMQMGGTPYAGVSLFGRMFSHKGLAGLNDVPPKVRAYIEKHAPEFFTVSPGWVPDNSRVDTWKAYAQDIPPENPAYPWKPSAFKVPTGSGRRG
jgi:Protein of unknown function (DUF1838)